jgi:hypothetical protein
MADLESGSDSEPGSESDSESESEEEQEQGQARAREQEQEQAEIAPPTQQTQNEIVELTAQLRRQTSEAARGLQWLPEPSKAGYERHMPLNGQAPDHALASDESVEETAAASGSSSERRRGKRSAQGTAATSVAEAAEPAETAETVEGVLKKFKETFGKLPHARFIKNETWQRDQLASYAEAMKLVGGKFTSNLPLLVVGGPIVDRLLVVAETVQIFWPKEQRWFGGLITGYEPDLGVLSGANKRGMHVIDYYDDEVRFGVTVSSLLW